MSFNGKFIIVIITTPPLTTHWHQFRRHNNHSIIILCSLYYPGAFLWFKTLTNPDAWQCIKHAGTKALTNRPLPSSELKYAHPDSRRMSWRNPCRVHEQFRSRWFYGGDDMENSWMRLFVFSNDINYSNNKWSLANAFSLIIVLLWI